MAQRTFRHFFIPPSKNLKIDPKSRPNHHPKPCKGAISTVGRSPTFSLISNPHHILFKNSIQHFQQEISVFLGKNKRRFYF